MKSLLVPIVLSTTVGIGGVVVAPIVTSVALNPQPVMPEKERFAIDEWSLVADYASQGIDVLHEKYKYDCANNKEFPNTLIGLERTVDINGHAHTVRVIGEEEDTRADGKKVALTFQFTNVISDENGNGIKVPWERGDDATNENYWDSDLYDFLNDQGYEDIPSVYEMIEDGDNDELAELIQPVSFSVNTFTDGDWHPTTNITKLFCPVIANYFSQETIRDYHNPKFCDEGTQYQYYVKNIGDSDFTEDHLCLELGDINNYNYSYWVTSPEMDEYHTGQPEIVSRNGHLSWGSCMHSLWVAPCFCI